MKFYIELILLIIVPLSWAIEPKDITVNSDKDMKVECRVNGLPKPTIKWISSKGYFSFN